MRIFLFLTYLLLFGGCTRSVTSSEMTPSEDDRLTFELIATVSKNLEPKYGLRLGGVGGSKYNKESWLYASYTAYYPLDRNAGRKLMITIIQTFLEEINKNEKSKLFAPNFPVSEKNITIDLISINKSGVGFYDPLLEAIQAFGGKIFYYTKSPEDPYTYKSEYIETYEEALRILREESIPNKNNPTLENSL